MNDKSERPPAIIRPVSDADETGIKELVTAAFGQETEARLTHRLRHCGAFVLELVATSEHGRILGHIGFSRVTPADVGPGQSLLVTCMAPVSVWPEFQHQGIGAAMIEEGISRLKELGEDLILVLGWPSYYPRFGFDAELARKVKAPYAGNAFMALALTEDGHRNLPVEVTFATPFQDFD